MSKEEAQRRVDLFERTEGRELVELAGHAALPVALDPTFVHLLRINYFLETLPYTAESVFLLSALTTEVDDGFYIIDREVRDVLLGRLIRDYGSSRIRDIARLLWEYSQKGMPWEKWPGTTEAQQLTALNFVDTKKALAWLEKAQQARQAAGNIDERWFIAMRQDLQERAVAVAEPGVPLERLPEFPLVLEELRDVLAGLYPEPGVIDKVAGQAGLSIIIDDEGGAIACWQHLLSEAWLEDRVARVLEIARADFPSQYELTRALMEYWIKMSPALLVQDGHLQTPPAEWARLIPYRGMIETATRAVGIMTLEGHPNTNYLAMGFLAGDWNFVAMGYPDQFLEQDADGRWRMPSGAAAVVYFGLEKHIYELGQIEAGAARKQETTSPVRALLDAQPKIRLGPLVMADKERYLVVFKARPDPTIAADWPQPLPIAGSAPSDLIGRKVYLPGYPDPRRNPRHDPAVVERIMGRSKIAALRVQPGEIISIEDADEALRAWGKMLNHNCFTLVGNGGSPLIDLETGEVLGIHMGGQYIPYWGGLKRGWAPALWPLQEDERLLQAGLFAAPTTAAQAARVEETRQEVRIQEDEANQSLNTGVPTAQQMYFEHGYALIIGVDENNIERLSIPVVAKDVQALRDVLIHPQRCAYRPENVRLLRGAEATKENILEAFSWLSTRTGMDSNATAVIYYSGHGTVDKKTERYYLIPYDIEKLSRVRVDAIPSVEIQELIRNIYAKRMMIIFDASHAAGFISGDFIYQSGEPELEPSSFVLEFADVANIPVYDSNREQLPTLSTGEGIAFLNSSGKNQASYIRSDQGMSIFTYHLIEALSGAGSQDVEEDTILVTDVMSWVSRQTARTAKEMLGKEQTPVMRTTGIFPVALFQGGPGRQGREPGSETQVAARDVRIGGDNVAIGNVSSGVGINVGRDTSSSNVARGEKTAVSGLDQLFVPLYQVIANDAPGSMALAIKLKEELERGRAASDEELANTILDLTGAAPLAGPAIRAIFKNPRIAELVQDKPTTRFAIARANQSSA